MLAERGAFTAVVDDRCDREGQTPDQVRELLGVLHGAGGPTHPEPAVRVLTDLWERTGTSALQGWEKRFVVLYEDFADIVAWASDSPREQPGRRAAHA